MLKFKTIQSKIMALFSLVVFSFFTVSFILQVNEVKEHAYETLESSNLLVKGMLGEYISAYIYNQDMENIQLSIDSIKSKYIKKIYIVNKNGMLLAKSNTKLTNSKPCIKFEKLLKEPYHEIKNNDEYIVLKTFSVLDVPIGYMIIEANLDTYYNHVAREVKEVIIENIIFITIFLFISFLIVKLIVKPIDKIVKRLQNTEDDEVLYFNEHIEEEFKYLSKNIADKHNRLQESKSQLATVFNMTNDGIAIVDLKAKFLVINEAFCKITKYTNSELLSMKLKEMVVSEDCDMLIILNEVLNKGYYPQFESRCTIKNKQQIDTNINMKMMPDNKSMMIVLKDITKEKQYKKEREMQERQLLQQSRMAQMGEMISMIAHQWRQPLAAIASTSLDMVLKIELGEYNLTTDKDCKACKLSFLNSLENIEAYTQNLTTTINDFRNFYKPNKLSVKVCLEKVVDKAIRIISNTVQKDNITIIYKHTCKVKVTLYEGEFMQVVLNIFRNMQDNFIDKDIKNRQIKVITDSNILYICDNGGGIPEDIIDKIFDPYFSTKDEKNGTGLGLYMSKTIIEDHHKGSISVENKEFEDGPDIGACFKVVV